MIPRRVSGDKRCCPFLPTAYAAIPALGLLTLMIATVAQATKTISLLVLAGVALNIYWPIDWIPG